MTTLVYNSFMRDVFTGAIDCDTDTFKAMLVTSAYTEDKDTHTKRSQVTNEVTGTGYTAGGVACTVTVSTVNTALDQIVVTCGAVSWSAATLTARKLVVYKSRGGASSADELVMVNDFGSDFSSTAGTFSVAASTITVQN